jgi:rhodanese-related sulfurtransferase
MENVLRKMNLSFTGTGQHKIMPQAFLEKENALFLDVRAKEEVEALSFNFNLWNIKVVNIPIDELPDRLNELPKDSFIGTFCASGTRSAWAYIYLLSKGYENVKWVDAGNEDFAALIKPGVVFKKVK